MNDPLKRRHRILGRYNPIQSIAQGGMGEIVLARTEGAEGFARPVVIKRIRRGFASADMERMFVREARLLSYMHHPGVVSVVDFGKDDDDFVMVLEYVHGYDLSLWNRFHRQRLRPFDPTLAMHVIVEVLMALDYVHNLRRADGRPMNLIHRDISPANVLIDTEGHVLLTDFGIAKAVHTGDLSSTKAGMVKGKLPYIAPELFSGDDPSPRADIYACGVMLHELLVGKNEFHVRGNSSATIHQARTHVPSRVADQRDDVPPGLDMIIAQALAKDPNERYAEAGLFAQDLNELLTAAPANMHRALRDAVQYDFLGLLPEVLEIPSLDDRARLLEEAPRMTSHPPHLRASGATVDDIPTDVGARARAVGEDDLPTEAVAPRPPLVGTVDVQAPETEPETKGEAEAPSPSRPASVSDLSSRRVPAAVAAMALIVASAALYIGIRSEPEQIYVVEERAPAQQPAPAAPQTGAGVVDPRELTRRIAEQEPAIRRCFELDSSVAAEGEVRLRFSLDASGAVLDVELLPASAAATETGRCLVDLGRRTIFPATGSSVAFEIPLRARVMPTAP